MYGKTIDFIHLFHSLSLHFHPSLLSRHSHRSSSHTYSYFRENSDWQLFYTDLSAGWKSKGTVREREKESFAQRKRKVSQNYSQTVEGKLEHEKLNSKLSSRAHVRLSLQSLNFSLAKHENTLTHQHLVGGEISLSISVLFFFCCSLREGTNMQQQNSSFQWADNTN